VNISTTFAQKNTFKHKLVYRYKLAGILSINEHDLHALIRTVENDPLFDILLTSGAVRHERKHRFATASDILEFDDNIVHHSPDNADISGIIDANKELLPVIRSIGIAAFKTYFYENEHFDAQSVSSFLHIPVATVQRIVALLNDVSMLSEFFHPSKIHLQGVSFRKVAKIDNEHGRLTYGCYSMSVEKGAYLIDDKKVTSLKRGLSAEEKVRVNEILSSLDMFNAKKAILLSIIETLMDIQKDFFLSNELSSLKVFSAKDLAVRLKISQSTVSRTIYARSLVTPHATEVSLQSLLPHNKDVIQHILRNSFQEFSRFSDEKIKDELFQSQGIKVSRRMVCKCRNEIDQR